MNQAAGARERHIERCKYKPSKKAERPVRNGKTLKLKDDLILVNSFVKLYKVERKGYL